MPKTYCSDPRGRKFLSAFTFIMTLVLIFLLNILRLYAVEKFSQYLPDMSRVKSLPEKVLQALILVLLAIYVVFIIILLPTWYKTIKYTITDKAIISRTGLFSRTYRIMKLSAIQHASKISMPLSKITCFNFISLGALGGNVVLMFLSDEDCTEIMKTLNVRLENSREAATAGKFTLSKGNGSADYIYTDRSGVLSLRELGDIAGDFSSYTQLSFTEPGGAQLSFTDIDGNGGDKA